MSPFEQLRDRFTAAIAGFDPVALGVQLLVLVLAFVMARMINRWYLGRVRADESVNEVQGLRRLTRRSIERIVLPLSMLVLVSAARGLVAAFDLNTYLLDIAIPVLASLALIRVVIYLLRKAFVVSPAVKAWEQGISLCIWGVVALHLLGWLAPVLDTLDALAVSFGSSRISVLSVLQLALMVSLLLALALWLARVLERRVARAEHFSPTLRVGIAKFSKFFLLGLAILVALDSAGIDLSSLAVFGGALGVGLGFGLQRIASNFISGFILIADRSIKPGDVITIGTKFGWVEEMRARYIVVRNRDGEENLIPNENLITSEVINWSYTDPNVRLKLPVSISYHDDPEQAMALMLEAGTRCARVIPDPEPSVRLMRFADSGIDLELRVWLRDPQNGLGNVRSEINLAIWRAFKEAGITIPFPQRDVHLIPAPPPPPPATPSA
ncbi:MAG TPA: mechanosensitive ion channel domain-containing protein [Gammaproteobacteria bacterium]